MIARMWHGRVPAAKADSYRDHLKRTGLAGYTATPGNLGVWVLRRTEGEVVHFLLQTFWDSWEAVEQFAGPDYARARYFPGDEDYLLEREPFATHYEVVEATGFLGSKARR